ncbi:hypothetical protein KAR91_30625 [Candidatus Pacearchaeota archaeon]|nr:hypothetical protein [Candidatus Pacearchaeota archaeon]
MGLPDGAESLKGGNEVYKLNKEMMNWKEIKEKYPKAWKCCYDWSDTHFETDIPIYAIGDILTLRHLYDFFDENDINIFVRLSDITNSFLPFDWDIVYEDIYHSSYLEYKTRKEAEQAAFTKAFEILEQKLT